MSDSETTENARLVHTVYFTLNEPTPENTQQLLDACQHFLTDHPGTDYFAVGTRVEDLQRPVNDSLYHVSLHVHFADRASHDQYQQDPRHLQFIEENKVNWAQVRVFDSYLA